VPLRSAVLLPDKRLLALIDERGTINPQVTQLIHETANA
jgi:hypothetical protein